MTEMLSVTFDFFRIALLRRWARREVAFQQIICRAKSYAAVAAVLLVSAGCGSGPSGPQRYPLSGTVTYEGKPVVRAEVFLAPNDDLGNTGPGSVAVVENGAFQVTAAKGIVGGPYRVSITSQSPVPLPEGESFTPQFPLQEIEVELPAQGGSYDFSLPLAKQ